MEKGDIVTVYSDPITQKNPEGEAKLLTLLQEIKPNHLAYWQVRFLSDNFICERQISTA